MKKGTRFKHLTWNDRLTIERMVNAGFSARQISTAIGCHVNTIYNELKRARYEHTNSNLTTVDKYNPDGAEKKYRERLKKKGSESILSKEDAVDLKEYIRYMICEQRYSPEAVLLELQKNEFLHFKCRIKSVNTIYAAIRKGLIPGVGMQDLPRHGKRIKKKKRVTIQKKAAKGVSIEKRPEEVNSRETFGHWEMDCVEGTQRSKKTLLVITERKTRFEIIELLKDHTMEEVVKALNRVEKRFKSDFYRVFQTITVDNGHEFNDSEGMEKAVNRVGKRTTVFYCHPRHPEERGTNENTNLLIRRWYPKGTDFDRVIKRTSVKDCEFWINTYPRKMFDGSNALELFNEELEGMGCRLIE